MNPRTHFSVGGCFALFDHEPPLWLKKYKYMKKCLSLSNPFVVPPCTAVHIRNVWTKYYSKLNILQHVTSLSELGTEW